MSSFEYIIPFSKSVNKLVASLNANLCSTNKHAESCDIEYLDTFDWLAYRKGVSIELVSFDNKFSFALREFHASRYLFTLPCKKQPVFASDITPGRFREQLAKIIDVRALMPKFKLHVKRHYFSQLNEDEKTVLRIVLHQYQIFDPASDKFVKLQNRLEVIPLRGYVKPIDSIQFFLEAGLGLARTHFDIVTAAVNHLKLQPTAYQSNPETDLNPQMTAHEALVTLLHKMLDVILNNSDGVCGDIDSEFLHDYRVAMRRMRSLLRQVKDVLPAKTTNYILQNLTWMSGETSLARDMDVYLLKFEDYKKLIPLELQENLEPLHALLAEKKALASKKLKSTLRSKRYATFIAKFKGILEAKPVKTEEAVNANRPIKELSDKRIWKAYRRVIREGRAINERSPADELHELRKSCKKLRYLMEFFRSLYDPESIKSLIVALKKIQENLGDFNDYHVQLAKINEFEQELITQEKLDANTRQAIGYLLRTLDELQELERDKFAKRFESFDTKSLQAMFAGQFKVKHDKESSVERLTETVA